MNIAHPIALHASFRAEKPALIDGETVVTFAEFYDRIRRTAGHLSSLGVRPGDDVAICLQEHGGTPIIWFALAYLGARLLPMDWRWMPVEQQRFVDAFKPRLMLVEPDRKVPTGTETVALDATWYADVAACDRDEPMAPGGDMPATVYITSGTTGVPKAYTHTHRSFLDVLSTHWIGLEVNEGDRCLSTMPLAFTAGRSIGMSTLLVGGTFILNPAFALPDSVLAAIRRHDVNAITAVPGLIRGLLELAPDDGLLLPKFRRLVSVGATLFPDEIRRIRERLTPHLWNYYGSSGAGSTCAIGGDNLLRKPGSVGRPMYGVEVEVVDDRDRPLPRGETGFLRARGYGMALGLHPPDPADRTIRDGWHYPGDYALIDDEGFVFLQGRESEMMNVGGMVVFSPEVERAIAGCPGVQDVAVMAIETGHGEEEIVAVVVAAGELDPSAITAHCRQTLAAYKRPRRLRLVENLPRNSNGKVLRSELAKMLVD